MFLKGLKVQIVLFIFALLFVFAPIKGVWANKDFARIKNAHTYLYKSAEETSENYNVVCIMENTYFVEITLNYSEKFFRVNYNGSSGYVLKNNVQQILGVPENPYPSSVKITTINGKCNLRSTPSVTSSNNVSVLPPNCKDLNYIGKVYGDEIIDFKGKLWYFVSYFGVCGYVYSEYIYNITSIYPNSEIFPYAIEYSYETVNPLSNSACVLIIIILLIPTFIIIYFLYKETPKKEVNKPSLPKKEKKTSNIDYDALL